MFALVATFLLVGCSNMEKSQSPEFQKPSVTAMPTEVAPSPSIEPIPSASNDFLYSKVVPYLESTPAFPESIANYELTQVSNSQSIRIFQEDGWVVPIPELDPVSDGGASMSCEPQIWVLRWRSDNPDVTIQVSTGITDFGYSRVSKIFTGGAGYLASPTCQVPAFKFGKSDIGATLVEVNFEYEIWSYKPTI